MHNEIYVSIFRFTYDNYFQTGVQCANFANKLTTVSDSRLSCHRSEKSVNYAIHEDT